MFILALQDEVAMQELGRKLSKCPVEVGTFPHWLIINGKQPAIPENAAVRQRQPPAKRRKVAPNQKPGKAHHSPFEQPFLLPIAFPDLSCCAGAVHQEIAGLWSRPASPHISLCIPLDP